MVHQLAKLKRLVRCALSSIQPECVINITCCMQEVLFARRTQQLVAKAPVARHLLSSGAYATGKCCMVSGTQHRVGRNQSVKSGVKWTLVANRLRVMLTSPRARLTPTFYTIPHTAAQYTSWRLLSTAELLDEKHCALGRRGQLKTNLQ